MSSGSWWEGQSSNMNLLCFCAWLSQKEYLVNTKLFIFQGEASNREQSTPDVIFSLFPLFTDLVMLV